MAALAEPQAGDALLIVDVQKDFLPGGALGIAQADQVVPVLNQYIASFERLGLPIFASRDWHPANHCSFVAHGGPWPAHCVAGTEGAQFAPGLALPPDAGIVSKATQAQREAYSDFEGTDLEARLRARGVCRLYVGGLATDYCVLSTVKDALALGFTVRVLGNAVRAVDVTPGDGERALEQMRALGAETVDLGAACER